MSKKLIYLVSFVLVLSVAGNASAGLVAHWPLDEGSGTTAIDLSGNGHDGTIGGTANWVAGQTGLALDFDGASTYIDMDDQVVEGTWSLAMWLRPRDIPYSVQDYYAVMHTDAWATGAMHLHLRQTTSLLNADFESGPDVTSTTVLQENEWYHAVVTVTDEGDGASQLYLNGVLEAEATGGSGGDYLGPLNFGSWNNSGRNYHGLMDDIRIYDHVLSEVEIMSAMAGEIWPYAWGPEPVDGALHANTWVNISWKPGGFAVSHDIYLGENFDDVDAGTPDSPGFQGNQAATFLVAGFPGFAYPDGLVPGTTYYWRIDEVNDTEPNSPWKGDVWSFSVPPKTAYTPDPADAAEQTDPDADLSWTPGFGAKLHTVYFSDNFDDVSSAAGGLPQGTATYDPGTLKLAKTYYWRVDEFDAIATYKGDVWSFTTQGAVGSPNPANSAVDVKQTQILTWSPGVFAASHELYFGTDKDAVKNADTGSPEYKGTGDLGAESYDPGMLEWDTTYYWRVDEANNVNPDSPWTGILWSFTTANFLIVDDFESYNDLDPAESDSNRIFNAWIDGYDDPENGSLVGYETPPFAEQTIVHGGNQSLPLYYDNSVGYSEATLTLTYPRDWTEKGVTTLTIWFRGDSANAAEALYVALNGNAIVTNDNPNAAQVDEWTEWNIDLQTFGVNLANVNTIALGLGNRNNPVAGGSGTMYFDDIRLYPPPME